MHNHKKNAMLDYQLVSFRNAVLLGGKSPVIIHINMTKDAYFLHNNNP